MSARHKKRPSPRREWLALARRAREGGALADFGLRFPGTYAPPAEISMWRATVLERLIDMLGPLPAGPAPGVGIRFVGQGDTYVHEVTIEGC